LTASNSKDSRDVVPRWRSVRRTLQSRELAPQTATTEPTPEQLALLAEREEDWFAKKTTSYAAELVATARLLRLPEPVDAIALLEDEPELPIHELLRQEPDPGQIPTQEDEEEQESIHEKPKRRIRELRSELARDPRNAIAWSELARHHATLGQQSAAHKGCVIALALSPTSRYLLRSSACFFTSVGEPERAWALLERAPNTRSDPWLASAHIAAARQAGRPVRGVKQARSLLEDANFSARDLTELASELGTLEMESNERRARKLFYRALVDPTDNSLAQVQWAAPMMAGLSIAPVDLSSPLAYEARARHAETTGAWRDAAANGLAWQTDQLFSVDAAMNASHSLAVGLNDWHQSFHSASVGLTAHPDDPGLLNNAAYSLIELSRLPEAEQLLRRIDLEQVVGHSYVSLCATHGLLEFRYGNLALGARLYERGISVAHAKRETTQEAMGLIMLAREQLNFDRDAGIATLVRAERTAKGTPSKAVERWLELVRFKAHGNGSVS
jgi:hypothetical protein